MSAILKSSTEPDKSVQALPSLRVLTSHIHLQDNQYITCLWSSVKQHGVDVDLLRLTQIIAQKIIGGQKMADVIHLHWVQKFCPLAHKKTPQAFLSTLKYLVGFIFLKLQGYKFVWTVHNTFSHDPKLPSIEYGFRWILSRICNDIIVMSEYGKQEFIQMFGRSQHIHIIPHGNYIGAYPNRISRSEARQKLGIAPDQKVFLHLGQLKPYKGINQLLVAFSQIRESDAVLLIAGSCKDDQLAEEIQQAARSDSRVLLKLEFIPDEDIQLYMNACDWVVLPYQKILNSGSALLALSFSRPVIVPQKGALTELIEDSKQGFCYAEDGDLAKSIDRALNTPVEQWKEMCAQAFTLAEQLDWSRIGTLVYHVYQ
ncbi:MAG: glycosyltransferase family 4 protein [Cyanobacteria bacterium CRU_2_1]|nr:glycosyltransferase family 4 protein [Cyanobacteria bacterium CRU_2_1]